mgnify:CR=1 FL=1
MKILKRVSYAYSTSPNALQFHFKTGGYVVDILKVEDPAQPIYNNYFTALAMFTTEQEAYEYLDQIDGETHWTDYRLYRGNPSNVTRAFV